MSLNPCFEKVPRPLTDRGKGSYWTVNDNVDPRTGVHRVRKKKGSKQRIRTEEVVDIDYHPPEVDPSTFGQVDFSDHQPSMRPEGPGQTDPNSFIQAIPQ